MKVLIIEDDISILNTLQQGLRYKDVVSERAINGLKGLELLKTNFYDLAIVDLGLPDIDGRELIKKIRARGVDTPILVLTANREVKTKTRLLEMGVDDFVEKPYSFDELFARITAILRREKRRFPSEYLKIEDLELFPEKRMAIRNGKMIKLRGKEFHLLKFFMSHLDAVLSRQLLIEEVWGYATTVPSNTVDTHVSNLRRKIDKDFKKKLIKTIHGIGYMMTADN